MFVSKLILGILTLVFIIFDIILLCVFLVLAILAFLEANGGSSNFVYYCIAVTLSGLFIPVVVTATVIFHVCSFSNQRKNENDRLEIQMEELSLQKIQPATYQYVTVKFENENQSANAEENSPTNEEIRPISTAARQTNYNAYFTLHNDSISESSTVNVENHYTYPSFRVEGRGNNSLKLSQVRMIY